MLTALGGVGPRYVMSLPGSGVQGLHLCRGQVDWSVVIQSMVLVFWGMKDGVLDTNWHVSRQVLNV